MLKLVAEGVDSLGHVGDCSLLMDLLHVIYTVYILFFSGINTFGFNFALEVMHISH